MSNNTNFRERLDKIGEEIIGKAVASSDERATASPGYNNAFWTNMQKAEVSNSLKVGSDGSGGYLVPDTFDEKIISGLEEKCTIRRISQLIKTDRTLKIPGITENGSASWCSENEEPIETDFETFEVEFGAHKLANRILLSDEFIQDTPADVKKMIYQFFTISVARKEEEAFIGGDGKGKPLGLIYQAETGVTTKNAGEITFDDLIDLHHSVPAKYRDGACWVMSDKSMEALMEIKDAKGQYLAREYFKKGDITTLFGQPVHICNLMDDIESGGLPVFYGNFDYFHIAERGNRTVKRLSERYAEFGQVGFITTERIDAKLVDKNAIKLLKVR